MFNFVRINSDRTGFTGFFAFLGRKIVKYNVYTVAVSKIVRKRLSKKGLLIPVIILIFKI